MRQRLQRFEYLLIFLTFFEAQKKDTEESATLVVTSKKLNIDKVLTISGITKVNR